MKSIGIIGSRRRNTQSDCDIVINKFREIYEEGDEIVSGGCPEGGDNFAEQVAKLDNITIKIYYAKWKVYGRRAGYIRNVFIAQDADVLIACVAADRKGGTEHTIKEYTKLGKKDLILV